MTNPTMFDPIALENWYADEENSLLLQTELEKYFQNYLPCFHSEPQRKLFRTIVDWRQHGNDANSESLVYEELKNGVLGLEPSYAVCDDSTPVYYVYTGDL